MSHAAPALMVYVSELSPTGVGYLLHMLQGLPRDLLDRWADIGRLVEQHRVSVDANDDGGWSASFHADGSFHSQDARDPRLAIGRALVGCEIERRPDSEFILALSLGTAFEFGLNRNSDQFKMLLKRLGVLDEDMPVELEVVCL